VADEVVEVRSLERVVEHGHAKVAWLVRQHDAWVAAGEVAGAEVQQLDPGPGTVWEVQTTLRLPKGTLLMRVESRPAAAIARDPLEYLARETRQAARRVQRTYHRVGHRGVLERVSSSSG
jgi:hypothetical protein